MKKAKEPSRIEILRRIFSDFQQITQWNGSHYDNCADSERKAEAAIILLEVTDCGSVGGYDKDSPCNVVTKYKLYDRFLAVFNKYNTDDDIFTNKKKKDEYCGFTIKTLGDYFKQSNELRGKILNSTVVTKRLR